MYLSIHSQFAVPASEVAIDAVVDVDISLESFQANLKMNHIINSNPAAESLLTGHSGMLLLMSGTSPLRRLYSAVPGMSSSISL